MNNSLLNIIAGVKMEWVKSTKLNGVSLCMIVKDEERNPAGGIAAFLEHHLPMVDEAIIADTGSKDGTANIAGRFDGPSKRVHVLKYPWDGSFSNARNFTIDNANYHHILVLDADERLEYGPMPIKQVLTTIPGKLFGYEFVFFDVKPDGLMTQNYEHTCPDGYRHRVRYFMNMPCLRFRGVVHEQLEDVGDQYQGYFAGGHKSSGLLVKHFLPSETELQRKMEFYKSLREVSRPKMAAA